MRKRIPLCIWNSLLNITGGLNNSRVAVDGTGLSLSCPSSYYLKRIDRLTPTKRFVKLSAFFSLDSKKFIAIRVRSKPRHDNQDLKYLLKKNSSMKKLFADSAYDAEFIHEECFYKGIQTIIKPVKTAKKGFFRKKQMKNYTEKEYHQRSNIEAAFSELKKRYGTSVLSKSIISKRAEINCRAIAYNLSLVKQEIFN